MYVHVYIDYVPVCFLGETSSSVGFCAGLFLSIPELRIVVIIICMACSNYKLIIII